MEHNTETIRPDGLAEFDAAVTFQKSPLTITGPAELIVDLHKEAESYVRTARVSHAAPKVARVAVATPETPAAPVYVELSPKQKISQWFNDAPLRRFDRTHGTSMYEALLAKREEEARFVIASQYKLIGDDGSLFYKRQLKKLVKGAIV